MKPESRLEECVGKAMDCDDLALVPYLPYILQDFFEIGSSPRELARLVQAYAPRTVAPRTAARNVSGPASSQEARVTPLRVLDLGCGKGAVSIHLARQLGCSCLGIDAIPEFIAEARKRAAALGVASLCSFEAADARLRVRELLNFDFIILGSIGPVFGDYHQTLETLKPCLADNGIIMVDDGYINEGSSYAPTRVQDRQAILEQIAASGMHLVAEVPSSEDQSEEYEEQFSHIKARCSELSAMHPELGSLFADYTAKQAAEYQALEDELHCAVFVIARVS
jgi:ubiquinone/menaquinone biosynthesis C-methylase UbiE